MIRVMLVDDQNLVRKGVRSLLELSEEIEVVAEAADGAEAIRMIPEVNPDVVLLDMRMPGLSGLDVLRELSKNEPLPPTIILTTFDDDELVLAGIQSGARGYLLKDVALADLVSAVKTVAEGGSIVKPAVTQRLLKGLANLQNDFSSLEQPDPLTDRETEILQVDGRRLQQQGNCQLTRAWPKGRSKTTFPISCQRWVCVTGHGLCSKRSSWARFRKRAADGRPRFNPLYRGGRIGASGHSCRR